MSLPLGSTCIKYLLFIFNLIFVVTGMILISVGAVIQASYYNYDHFLDAGFFSIPALLIAIGIIVFIVSFFGCCGAFKENYCMTVTFCVFLILIFVLELVGGISGYILRDRATDVVIQNMKSSMPLAYNNSEISGIWNQTQSELKCCGTNGPKDWTDQGMPIPITCCENNASCNISNAYSIGCAGALGELIISKAAVLGGVGIGIAIIQLLGIIFACNLGSSIRRNYETV